MKAGLLKDRLIINRHLINYGNDANVLFCFAAQAIRLSVSGSKKYILARSKPAWMTSLGW